MLYPSLFFLELFGLFFLSQQLTRALSRFFYHVTRSKKLTIYILSFLFFPGTLLHELSHAFMAIILFVPVGKMDLLPKIEGETIKMGSVAVAHTDIIRRFFIGIAPFLLGTTLLLGLLFYAEQHALFTQWAYLLLLLYAAFEISNTMYSSKKDMEGALEFIGGVLFLIIITVIFGWHLPFEQLIQVLAQPPFSQVFYYGSLFLLIPIGVDALIILLFTLTRHKLKPHHHHR